MDLSQPDGVTEDIEMTKMGSDTNCPENAPKYVLAATTDSGHDATAESAVDNVTVAATADDEQTTVDTAEELVAKPLTTAALAVPLADGYYITLSETSSVQPVLSNPSALAVKQPRAELDDLAESAVDNVSVAATADDEQTTVDTAEELVAKPLTTAALAVPLADGYYITLSETSSVQPVLSNPSALAVKQPRAELDDLAESAVDNVSVAATADGKRMTVDTAEELVAKPLTTAALAVPLADGYYITLSETSSVQPVLSNPSALAVKQPRAELDDLAESAVDNVSVAATADGKRMTVDTAEELVAKPLTTATLAVPLADGDYITPSETSSVQPVLSNRSALEERQPRVELDDSACVFVVHCAPKKDTAWAWVTCLIALVSAFIGDGVWLSLSLLDARVSVAGRIPAASRTFEHMAVYMLCFFAVGPFACALVNRHGFRTIIFLGSLLTIAWSTCLWSIAEVFVGNRALLLAVVGGMGAGLMRTSFTILLSLLFSMSRQKAHLCMHLGGFAGMMLMTAFTEFIIILLGSKTALMINMILTMCTSVFWLFIATPVPQKVEVIDSGSKDTVEPLVQTKSKAIARNAQTLVKSRHFPTVWNTVGNRRLRLVPFTVDTPLLSRTQDLESCDLHRMEKLYEMTEPKTYHRNLTSLFGPTYVGSRPMYRDDVLFTGNIFHLIDQNLKCRESLYPLFMTRIMTMSDLKDELKGWTKLWPTSMSRTFNSIMSPVIWKNVTFMLYATIEFLVYAARFIPLLFIIGLPCTMKSSFQITMTLVAGCSGMMAGRSFGFVVHETTTIGVPLYFVGIILITNGLSLFLITTANFVKIIPYFGLYGLFFGYYNSVQNALVYNVFPVDRLSNVFGYVYLFRGLGSCLGILIAVNIQENDWQNNGTVYMFAGALMLAAGIFAGILHAAVNCEIKTARETSCRLYIRYPNVVYPTSMVTKVTASPPIIHQYGENPEVLPV